MKDLWTRFSCHLIGWNYDILKDCSEASRKALHRYTGAVMLMMLMWSFIGYCMAIRYFDLEKTGAIIVATAFAIVILLIERQIILVVGKNTMTLVFRSLLALCMSLIGATIIDQYMFGKDIDAAMHHEIEQRTDDQLGYRQQIVDRQIVSYRTEIDSLQLESARLSNEIAKQPMVKTTTYNKQATGAVDSLGNPIMVTGYQQHTVENPKQRDLIRVNGRIDLLQQELMKASGNLLSLRDSLYAENERNIGLLTELKVTFSDKVIFSSLPSAVFYLVVLLFFLMIELLIVSGKLSGTSKCDYEALVEINQENRISDICAITSKYRADS